MIIYFNSKFKKKKKELKEMGLNKKLIKMFILI